MPGSSNLRTDIPLVFELAACRHSLLGDGLLQDVNNVRLLAESTACFGLNKLINALKYIICVH